ncbi:MAG: monovalent cation/H+ antiporter complex subunit F [Balneolaceae bacterium]
MTQFFLYSTVLLTIIIAVPLVRVVKGPTIYDRLMGANAIATKTIVLICLIGFMYGRIDMFIDITLAYAILGFIGVLAIAKFVSAKRIDDP